MDQAHTVFRNDDRHPEQQPPMRQQGDRWPEELEPAGSGDGADRARPSDLDGV